MKVIILGRGFISDHLPYEKCSERVLLSDNNIEQILDRYKPDAIINCIGKTGRPNVDWCESHKEETAVANIALPIMLAQACEKKSVHMVHIGSGCIYFGESPNLQSVSPWYKPFTPAPYKDLGWKETDFANPKSYYSKTKYACDLALGQMNVATLRIRMPISTQNSERNFINKVKGYNQIIDIPNSVTFIDDLVRAVEWFVKNSKTGIYHVVNPEPLSAADVMKEYQKYVPSHKFEIITEAELDKMTVAKRSNCILNSDKLKNDGFIMTPSEIALKECMAKYAKSI